MSQIIKKIIPFNTKKSVRKARARSTVFNNFNINSEVDSHSWSTKMERVELIRNGISYDSIEVISSRLNQTIKSVLSILGIPQTTYNKKKSEKSLLGSRDSELIILITELLDYGLEVFNEEEEKFQRWLKKPNLSLGGNLPESLLDTTTGIEEVKFSLNRIEFGNFS